MFFLVIFAKIDWAIYGLMNGYKQIFFKWNCCKYLIVGVLVNTR